MSSDEDEEQLKQFLEAADSSLLNNDMFRGKCEDITANTGAATGKEVDEVPVKKTLPVSQRYLLDDEETAGTDFNLPESMQIHMAKKLSDILKRTYEFYDVSTETKEKKKSKIKSCVKLLKGDEYYVNSYEDFEYETKGPDKKPEIKRRCIDMPSELEMPNEDNLRSLAVDGNDILSGKEVKSWAAKKERKDKIFHYREGANGTLNEKWIINEFTTIRRKNNWGECKIKNFKRN